MGHNSWIAKVERIEREQRSKTDHELGADAVALVAKWNADIKLSRQAQYGHAARAQELPQFTPTIGAALRAGKPFLRILCRACQQVGHVDLRKVVRPSTFPITGIYDALRCQGGCRDSKGDPVLMALEGPGVDSAGTPLPAITARLMNSW